MAGSVETDHPVGDLLALNPDQLDAFRRRSMSWAGGMIAASICPAATARVASVPVLKLLMTTLTPYFL